MSLLTAILGERLDKRFGRDPGITYSTSPHRVLRRNGTVRVFLSAEAKQRYQKNRRRNAKARAARRRVPVGAPGSKLAGLLRKV